MSLFRTANFYALVLLPGLLLILSSAPSMAAGSSLFGKQEINETERQETLERINSIQEKLKLLQDKLRVLERRKAAQSAEQAAEHTAGVLPSTPLQINWQGVDATDTNPGEFGLYSYLLFKGNVDDQTAVGTLEDFILTIETLPANDIPERLANIFLLPVEQSQSLIKLGRSPYDFKLNDAYLRRLELPDNLPTGPVLVSLRKPVDPYGTGAVPGYLAVSLGQQTAQRVQSLARIWHRQEKATTGEEVTPAAELFWALIEGAGPTQVVYNRQQALVVLPQR